MMCH